VGLFSTHGQLQSEKREGAEEEKSQSNKTEDGKRKGGLSMEENISGKRE